jgi:hypothetical protein
MCKSPKIFDFMGFIINMPFNIETYLMLHYDEEFHWELTNHESEDKGSNYIDIQKYENAMRELKKRKDEKEAMKLSGHELLEEDEVVIKEGEDKKKEMRNIVLLSGK